MEVHAWAERLEDAIGVSGCDRLRRHRARIDAEGKYETVRRGRKGSTVVASVPAKASPQPEDPEAERSKNLGLEVVQFMGSPAGLALGTVVAGLLISWLRRRSRSKDLETGSSSDV